MNTMRVIAVIAATFILEGALSAQQQYTYQADVTEKTVTVEGLDFPGTTPLLDVLSLIPEYLGNSNSTVSTGQYDILIEGISVNSAASSVLSHLQLSDVKAISISDSPTASQQRNGSGGVINISLIDVPEGLSGRTSVHAISSGRATESAMVNYRKEKFTVRSWILVDNSFPGYKNEFRTLETDHGTVTRTDTTRARSNFQMCRIMADYNPTSKDAVRFRFWESSQGTENVKLMKMIPSGESDSGGRNKSNSASVSTTLAYSHSFTKDISFSAQADYSYGPGYSRDERRNPFNIKGDPAKIVETLNRGHNWNGSLSFGMPVIKSEDNVIMNFRTGANLTARKSDNEYSEKFYLAALMLPSSLDGDVVTEQPWRSLYLSPYIELGGGWPKLKYSASLRYQNMRNTTGGGNVGKKETTENRDLTYNFSLNWQLPHQNLRLIFDRGIIRPSDWQMNPMLIYRPDQDSYIIGNPDLVSSKLNSVNLNYIANVRKGERAFIFNSSLGFVHADALINSTSGITETGVPIAYTSFENSGLSNILKADMLCSYDNGPMTVSLASNFYHKLQKVNDDRSSRTYYNVAFGLSRRFRHDWTACTELVFNSPIKTQSFEFSPCVFGNFNLSKSWKRVEVFAGVSGLLQKHLTEVTISDDLTTDREYGQKSTSVFLGFSFRF